MNKKRVGAFMTAMRDDVLTNKFEEKHGIDDKYVMGHVVLLLLKDFLSTMNHDCYGLCQIHFLQAKEAVADVLNEQMYEGGKNEWRKVVLSRALTEGRLSFRAEHSRTQDEDGDEEEE